LSSLVDKDRPKLELAQPRVSSTDAGAADNVGGVEDLLLASSDEHLILPLVTLTELSLTLLQLDELLKVGVGLGVGDLLVKGEERDRRVEGFSRFCGDSNDLETGSVDLLGELVDGDVGGSTDEDLSGVHFGEVIDDGGGGDGLSSSGRTLRDAKTNGQFEASREVREWRTNLNETQRLLENTLDGKHLRVVELGKTRSGESGRVEGKRMSSRFENERRRRSRAHRLGI